jgi:uncharacterized protein YigA (DUF484 family)
LEANWTIYSLTTNFDKKIRVKEMMSGELDEKDVLNFIESRPDFLETHFGQGGSASNPNLIDATGKIAANAREEARRLSQANQSLLDAAATNILHWQALHHATLGFLACNDLTSFAQMLDEELPIIFGLAGARLLMPEQSAIPQAEELGFLVLPASEIGQLLAAGSIYLGPAKGSGLFSTPVASMAAIALPDQLPPPIAGSALVLAGRDKASFTPEQGQTLLTNLAEIAGVCLLARLETG